MVTIIAPIAQDLGGLIVCLPILQAAIEEGRQTYLLVRSPWQRGIAPRIIGLHGAMEEPDFDLSLFPKDTVYINLRNHPLQSSYLWGSPEFTQAFPHYKINDILKGICRDFQIPHGLSQLKPLAHKPIASLKETVAFIPGSHGRMKCWPEENWLALHETLKARSIPTVVLGQPERSKEVKNLLNQGLNFYPSQDLGQAVDILSSVRATVSIDTGLMHLSVQQGTPTIGLFRANNLFCRPYLNFQSLVAGSCPAQCQKLEFATAVPPQLEFKDWSNLDNTLPWQSWQCQAEAQDHCMSSISWQAVLEKLKPFL